jgi:GTP-binding protein HflX
MKAILVLLLSSETKEEFRESLEELKELVRAVGGKVLGYIYQRRHSPDPRYYIGAGKAQELKEVISGTGADCVVFDSFLSPFSGGELRGTFKGKGL